MGWYSLGFFEVRGEPVGVRVNDKSPEINVNAFTSDVYNLSWAELKKPINKAKRSVYVSPRLRKAKEWYIYGELDDFQKIGKYTAIVSVYVNLAKKMKKLHISILGGSPNKKERESVLNVR